MTSSELFATVSSMSKGQEVRFSGSFLKGDAGCIGEQSMTLDGKLEDPEFTFKFSSVSVLTETVTTQKEKSPIAPEKTVPKSTDQPDKKAT